MSRLRAVVCRWFLVWAVVAVLVSWGRSASARNYRIERIASGLNQPTYVTQAPNDPVNILYYTERTRDANPGFGASNVMGRIWRYDVTTRTKTLVLDLSSRSVTQDTGLQTIAFHPDFNTAGAAGYGKLFVSSAHVGTTAINRVEEYTVDLSGATPTYSAAFSRLVLEYQNNAQLNHTIDWIGFDPTATGAAKDYLYISTGDGSFGNAYNGGTSPTGRPSQNPSDVAGKMLRVAVSGADAYPADPLKNFAIPSSNPLPTYNAAHPGSPITGLGEVYLTGLRNVYRASFDRANGDLWMGDVGEVKYEEVSYLKAGSNTTGPPVDFGWPQREGNQESDISGAPKGKTNPFTGATSLEPVQQFLHDGGGEAVIGGYVYRGPVQELQGKYFFADFVTTGNAAQFWKLDFDRNTSPGNYNGNNGKKVDVSSLWQSLVYDPTDPSYGPDSTTGSSAGLDHIVSFGEDNSGNVYLVDFGNGAGFNGQYPGAGAGEIFRIVPSLAVVVTVDRNTGAMQFSNQTGAPISIRGYSIASAAGALDGSQLTPVAGRLDAPPVGDGSIDPVNDWQISSPANSHALFSEASTGGATSLGVGQWFELSPADGWIRSIYEDLDLRLTLADGSIVDATVLYTGNGGETFDRSDLNFDGLLTQADWNVFRAYHLQSMVGLSIAQSYGRGDLDGDGDNDFADFRLFQADYTAANGAAAFAQLLTVPEPGGVILACLAAIFLSGWRKRVGGIGRQLAAIIAGILLLVETADAAIVRQYTFNDGTANDSIGAADGMLQGNAVISLGSLDLAGDGGYVDLPASTINITSFTDATFEAWFTWRGGGAWQRVFDFGRTVSGSGRDYIFYTPSNGGENRAAFRDSNFAENVASGGPTLDINTPYHLAVVVDDDANGGTNRMTVYLNGSFRGDVALSYSFSDLSTLNRLAYLGRSLFSADPYFNGTIDEFRIHDTALTATQVASSYLAGPVPLDFLQLQVNTVSGEVSLQNQYAGPLEFDYYRVSSASGALAPSTWNSLDDQGVGSIGDSSWDEMGAPSAHLIAELHLQGSSTLASGSAFNLGQLYDPSVAGKRQQGDLVFEFALKGEGTLRQGTVSYIIPPPLPGDYSDNGDVDAADYAVWRDHLNSAFPLPNEVAGVSPGAVTMEDYDAWKSRFGNSLGGSGMGSAAYAVPESANAILAAMGLVGILISRATGRNWRAVKTVA